MKLDLSLHFKRLKYISNVDFVLKQIPQNQKYSVKNIKRVTFFPLIPGTDYLKPHLFNPKKQRVPLRKEVLKKRHFLRVFRPLGREKS